MSGFVIMLILANVAATAQDEGADETIINMCIVCDSKIAGKASIPAGVQVQRSNEPLLQPRYQQVIIVVAAAEKDTLERDIREAKEALK
jgi:hypothetical protein